VDATRVREPSVDWQINFPDWPVAMRALDDKRMVVLSDDGTLRMVQSNGKVAWEKTISGGEAWSLDVSANGGLIAVGTCHRIIGLNAKGKELFNVPIVATDGDDAGAMGKYPPLINWVRVSPAGDRVLASAGINNWTNKWRHEGRLLMVSAKGETIWTQGGADADPEKPPVLPDAFKAGVFTVDGSRVILLKDKEAIVIGAVTGKTESTIADVSGGIVPLAYGDGFIVSHADGKLAVLTAAAGKPVAEVGPANLLRGPDAMLDAPKEGVVSMALLKDSLVLGTESDGAVRALGLSAAVGFPFSKELWQNSVYTKIVKSVKTDDNARVAVNYWGGTVRILSADGKLMGERIFEQDITAMEWLGDRLIVGGADGRVYAMEGP